MSGNNEKAIREKAEAIRLLNELDEVLEQDKIEFFYTFIKRVMEGKRVNE